MILLVHLLLGALIGQKIPNLFLAIILAFLSHYLLDFIPHMEYEVKNIVGARWKKSLPDLIKVFLDFISGIILIFIFSKNWPIIYVCAFFAILPDGLSLLNMLTKNKFLRAHSAFHQGKIHFLKDNPPPPKASARQRKISRFWRVFSQVVIAAICLMLLKF